MTKFNMLIKVHLHLVSLVVLLLVHEPSSKLANGQLEAVGAVLSVVPVTSILATAGLVGVKLAALSKLLNILGYDRAYLAQNMGTGTAASPIGLQTRYAYMFPYVPGLNISVRGDDSIGMPKDVVNEMAEDGSKVGSGSGVGASNSGSAGAENKRKTYPAMGLPGDYEKQPKPFRGSGQLKDIFKKVGLQAHVPTPMQQQQLQQKFNLPLRAGKQAIIIELPHQQSAADKHPIQQRQQQRQPIATVGKEPASGRSNTAPTPLSSNPLLDMSRGNHESQVPVLHLHPRQSAGQSQPHPQLAQVQAQVQQRQQQQHQQPQQVQRLQQTSHQTFGMPASNINKLRRRRRQIGGGVNSLAVKLAGGARRLRRISSNSIQ